MQWLPGISIGKQIVWLPTVDSDLIAFANALLAPDPEKARTAWFGVLLRSPTILVWAKQSAGRVSNISKLVDALTSGVPRACDNSLIPDGLSRATTVDWGQKIDDYLRFWTKLIEGPIAGTPHLLATSVSRATAIAGKSATKTTERRVAPIAVTDRDLDLLSVLSGVVRPYWSAGEEELIQGITELFEGMDSILRPDDRHLARETFREIDRSNLVDSWNSSSIDEFSWLGAPVIARLETGIRLATDFEAEKLASLKQLAYGASHEINNPLANIATRAQLLLANEKDESRRKHLKTIFQQAMRAHEMISDMMLFAHPPKPDVQSVDLQEVVGQACREFSTIVEEAGWTIECNTESSALVCLADPSQLMSMIQAILQNSIETRDSGRINVTLEGAAHGKAMLEIRDNGPGVSPQVAQHMFDPFFSGREAGRGLGFGLSKAWTIVRLHGGSIRVKSTGDNGTTIAIELPIHLHDSP